MTSPPRKKKPKPSYEPKTPAEKAKAFEVLRTLQEDAVQRGRFLAELEAAMERASKKPPKA